MLEIWRLHTRASTAAARMNGCKAWGRRGRGGGRWAKSKIQRFTARGTYYPAEISSLDAFLVRVRGGGIGDGGGGGGQGCSIVADAVVLLSADSW